MIVLKYSAGGNPSNVECIIQIKTRFLLKNGLNHSTDSSV